LNENTNGLVRQYFPKKHDFVRITNAEVQRVAELLNNRPRKTLGYRTPNEVFFKERFVALLS
jgi:transposase, IS30 family